MECYLRSKFQNYIRQQKDNYEKWNQISIYNRAKHVTRAMVRVKRAHTDGDRHLQHDLVSL